MVVSEREPGDSSKAWTLHPTTWDSRTVDVGHARDSGDPICSDSVHEGSSRTVAVHDSVHEEVGDGIVRETNPRTVDVLTFDLLTLDSSDLRPLQQHMRAPGATRRPRTRRTRSSSRRRRSRRHVQHYLASSSVGSSP